jgi:hypothetical protein
VTALHTVHVRVNDAATGQPTPVRIRLTNPDGDYFAPFGRLAEFATGRNQAVGGNVLLGMKPYAYIDGSCEVRLPAGPIRVEIHKGPEYTSHCAETILGIGKMALRFNLNRWINLREERWHSGDMRAHFLSPHAALLEAAAEDLAVVNVLAAECRVPGPYNREYPAIPNIVEFSGQRPALESPGHIVVVNTHNSHPLLGSLGLLNCHRVVYPLSFGGPEGREDWSLADWCDQCHRKGGLVVWTKVWHEAPDFAYGEPLADMILDKVDALEIDYFENSVFGVLADWYKLLNCGFRVPLVGGSGKDSNGVVLGAVRTYARLLPDQPLTYLSWIEAVRAGRTFVTNGPILFLTVDNEDPGATLELAAGQPVHVRAQAQSQVPFERLELVANGTVIADKAVTGSPASALIECKWTPASSCWLAARCWGQHQLPHRPANQCVYAHTSPMFIRYEAQPLPVDPAAVAFFSTHLDRIFEWVTSKGRFENDRQRENLVSIVQTAREVLARRGHEAP